ncbi:unnamed protein product [Darwinula stevensoni]|uniref:N(6)-L-threonylcarbamoyladenine synthase n=1 Tax=Darwinula stevensoni TaxID=69355 RepID=A0A7R8X2U7_9CRUS|nr:unnamed protein product [Darwinula stevensoni]CAG0881611.1 unnamed protein product [Darwinula stevensoni]
MYLASMKTLMKILIRTAQPSRRASCATILGIESSCDDTGAAVVNEAKEILGEALHSQKQLHIDFGGIIPPFARELHRKHLPAVVDSALSAARMTVSDVDAIAVTVKPGKHDAWKEIELKMKFPFLVLLVSGGHCILALVRGVTSFSILGSTLDDSPGEALDKSARRMKLRNLPELSMLSGGEAIEKLAQQGDPSAFQFPFPLGRARDCNFSFSGLKFYLLKTIRRLEEKQKVEGDQLVPELADLCASFQFTVMKHLCTRVQRGMGFLDLNDLMPKNERTLVVSGGVASNNFLRSALERVCNEYNYKLVCPPPRLCTDNGVMIAWNGVEKWIIGCDITHEFDSIVPEGRCVNKTTHVFELLWERN